MTCRCPGGPGGVEHNRRASESAYESLRDTERNHKEQVKQLEAELARQRTSTSNYTIERVQEVGRHLVLQVKYPSCEHRAYEGLKTMVFMNTNAIDALKWKSIDPHFRGPAKPAVTEAPSPAARFPGDTNGWTDAVTYARGKE